MPKTTEVTYERVAEVCDRLTDENRRVSNRTVRAETGGNTSTVSKYIREWRQRRSAEGKDTLTLSHQLMVAIMAEVKQHSAGLREELQKQIRDAELRETEHLELLKEAESRIEELSAELKQTNEEKERSGQEAEMKVALCEQRALAAEEKSRETEERLASVQRELAEAEKRAAVAEGRSGALADYVKHMERESARLSSSLEAALRVKGKPVRGKNKESGK